MSAYLAKLVPWVSKDVQEISDPVAPRECVESRALKDIVGTWANEDELERWERKAILESVAQLDRKDERAKLDLQE